MRVGVGYDAHPLVEGRRLVLGGVEVPFSQGLSGHSDADVVVHAIIDALLGATALGDIGTYFPQDDPQYENASSIDMLRKIGELVREKGWYIINLDATIVAEKPRLTPFIDKMREYIGKALAMDISRVGLKATTTDHLGFVGRGEGMAAYAVALVGEKG